MRWKDMSETCFAARRILILVQCLYLVSFQLTIGQEKRNSVRNTAFQWDWHGSQDLSARNSLRAAKIPETDRRAITAAIMSQLRPGMLDLEIKSEEELKRAALDTRIKRIDLNSDAVPEIVAQGMTGCGATGNCPFWIFQKTGKGYRLLLEDNGQSFTIQPNRTHGYSDIVVRAHGSAAQSGLSEYKYDADRYVREGCYNVEWTILEGEHVRELKEPRITRFRCRS
jgi:hypothetical protein